MTNPRFFCPIPIMAGQTIDLPEEIAHHVRVLRLATDSQIVLFDGRGGEIPARLGFEGKRAIATLGELQDREAELLGEITVLQGIPSGDKMDWVIEKCVEVGVNRVVPIQAQRSVLQLSGARLDKRLQHWRRVAQAASEQCGRNRLMEVCEPVTLKQAISTDNQKLRLCCDPDAKDSLSDVLEARSAVQAIELLIGPEGGWSPTETVMAMECHAVAVRYGLRILRTETAAIALASAVSALMRW